MIVDDLTDTDNGTKYMGFSKLPRKKVRRIDIRFVPFDYYPAALLYFTGSYELNTQMRQVAKSMGYKLNEYGFRVDCNMPNNIGFCLRSFSSCVLMDLRKKK